MFRVRLVPVLVLLALSVALSVVLVGCGGLPDPTYSEERPVGSGAWVQVAELPAWTGTVPAREGYLRMVVSGKSDMRGIIATGDRPMALRDVQRLVRQVLGPVVGDAAAEECAAGVEGRLVMVERACKEEVLTRRAVPGNTLCTAWSLWEVPLDDVVAPLPDERRPAARAALEAVATSVR